MEYIKYTGLQGFIYSSKKSLKEMMKADVISVDATFNMLEDSEVKFITVSFKKELPDGSNPGVFLGCIATLRGGESSRNYTHFFLNLRALILKVFGPGAKSNAKTILTDESQAELTGISRAFDGSVTVRNCVWHKRLTFERNLDVKDVTFAVKALYATTEIECVNLKLLLMEDYLHSIQQLEKKLQDIRIRQSHGNFSSKDDDYYYFRSYKRSQNKKKSSIKCVKFKPKRGIAILKDKIFYIYKNQLEKDGRCMVVLGTLE